MNLPRVSYRPGMTLQALVNLMVTLWSKFLGARLAPVLAPSELAGIDVEAGTSKYVEGLRTNFTYQPGCTLAADGITVVASPYGGAWVRDDTEQKSWGAQPIFYIDPGPAGSDLNPGTPALPLKTIAEWNRRVPVVLVDMVVNLVAGLPATDPLPTNIQVASGASLNIVGRLPAAAPKTGLVDLWVPAVPGTPASALASFEDADADFSGDVGKLIHFVREDAWARIITGTAGGLAQVTRPLIYGASYIVTEGLPLATDEYRIYDPIDVHVTSAGLVPNRATLSFNAASDSVALTNLRFMYAGAETMFELSGANRVILVRCTLPENTFMMGNFAVQGTHGGEMDVYSGGHVHLFGYSSFSETRLHGDCSIWDGGVTVEGAELRSYGRTSINGPIVVNNSPSAGVRVFGNLYCGTNGASISGTGNANYGLEIAPGGRVTNADDADALAIEGIDIDHDLHVGEAEVLQADLHGAIAAGAALALTPCVRWTQFNAASPSFAGKAFNLNNGAYIGP